MKKENETCRFWLVLSQAESYGAQQLYQWGVQHHIFYIYYIEYLYFFVEVLFVYNDFSYEFLLRKNNATKIIISSSNNNVYCYNNKKEKQQQHHLENILIFYIQAQ